MRDLSPDWRPENRFRMFNIAVAVLALLGLASSAAVYWQAGREATHRARAVCPGAEVEYAARGRAVIAVDGDPTAPYFSHDVRGCPEITSIQIVCASWVPFLCGAVPEEQEWTDWTLWQQVGHR